MTDSTSPETTLPPERMDGYRRIAESHDEEPLDAEIADDEVEADEAPRRKKSR